MYTKCPACRTEISFITPTNANWQSSSYKHRIICPHCGIAFAVDPKQCYGESGSSVAYKTQTTNNEDKTGQARAAYDKYVALLAKKLENGSSTKRNLALALKTIVITLFVGAMVLIAIGIAFFVLYMLNTTDNIALSFEMEEIVQWYWIYGAVGFVAGLLLIWANSAIDVRKKDKVVDSEELANARREFNYRANLAGGVSSFKDPIQAARDKYYSEHKTTSSAHTTVSSYGSGIPQSKNFLESLVDKATAWSDKQAYGEIFKNSSNSKYCGRCRYYMPTDSQGYAPGQCARHSRTVCWGDGACDDFE